MINIRELENKILKLEELVIVFRANPNALVNDYTFERKASDDMTVSSFIERRVIPITGAITFSIIGGNYQQPHPRALLGDIRKGYEH